MREEHAPVAADDYPFILTLSPAADQVAIRFKTDLLKPVQAGSYLPYPSNPPQPELRLSLGVRIVVSTDAHTRRELENMRYGVDQARRAWCAAGDVLNTLPWPEFDAWLRRRAA